MSNSMPSSSEQFVKYALHVGAIEFVPEGRKLKSGRIAPHFFNSGKFNTGATITRLASAYVSAAKGLIPDVVFGPSYKGIPLAVAVAQALGGDVGYAFNRKEAKDHGEGGMTVGAPLAGKRVLIVDDVMTTGTSSGEAVEIIRANGGHPIAAVIAFDRQEQGKDSVLSATQEFTRNYGIPVRAAGTFADLIKILEWAQSQLPDERSAKILDMIHDYRLRYGA